MSDSKTPADQAQEVASEEPLLEIDGLSVSIEDHSIVEDVDIKVNQGESVGLIGRNGAGKTTTFRGIMQHSEVTVTSGDITFDGTDLRASHRQDLAKMGIGYQAERDALFNGMTVNEHFRLPIWVSGDDVGIVDEDERVEELFNIFPAMKEFKQQNVNKLSGGQRKMTAIGSALALNPDLVILDEPLEGLAPTIVEDIKEVVNEISEQGIAVMLAEANLAHAQELVDRVYIIERGEIYDHGSVDELIERKEIQNLLQG